MRPEYFPRNHRLFVCSIINERKSHSNFQLIIITHDENFLRRLGQSDVMEYYWYSIFLHVHMQFLIHLPPGVSRETRVRNLSLSVRGSDDIHIAPVPPFVRLTIVAFQHLNHVFPQGRTLLLILVRTTLPTHSPEHPTPRVCRTFAQPYRWGF